MKKAIIVLLAFPFFTLVGCQKTSTQEATAQLCGHLAKLDQAVSNLSSLTPASTVGTLKATKREIDDAMANVNKSGQNVKEARINDLNNANNNFNRTVQGISNRQTLASAASSIQQSGAKVKAAEAQLYSSIKCTP